MGDDSPIAAHMEISCPTERNHHVMTSCSHDEEARGRQRERERERQREREGREQRASEQRVREEQEQRERQQAHHLIFPGLSAIERGHFEAAIQIFDQLEIEHPHLANRVEGPRARAQARLVARQAEARPAIQEVKKEPAGAEHASGLAFVGLFARRMAPSEINEAKERNQNKKQTRERNREAGISL